MPVMQVVDHDQRTRRGSNDRRDWCLQLRVSSNVVDIDQDFVYQYKVKRLIGRMETR